jgi:hypothetical protein
LVYFCLFFTRAEVASGAGQSHPNLNFFRGKKDKDVTEIQYHDLRFLENQFQHILVPTVIVRKHAVLMSLNPLRAIVTADRLILIVPDGADSLLYMLHDFMHGKNVLYMLCYECVLYEYCRTCLESVSVMCMLCCVYAV